jgi:hypothetical protein
MFSVLPPNLFVGWFLLALRCSANAPPIGPLTRSMLSQQQCWHLSRRRITPSRIALVRRLSARGVRGVRSDIHRATSL